MTPTREQIIVDFKKHVDAIDNMTRWEKIRYMDGMIACLELLWPCVEAHQRIAKVKFGLDGNESKGYLAEYWAKRALEYEAESRHALSCIGKSEG